MNRTVNQPRKTKKTNTPELETLTIPAHKRGRLLGVGGINLKKILAQTGISHNPQSSKTMFLFRCHNLAD